MTKPPRPNIAPDRESIFANGREVCDNPKMRERFSMEAGVIAAMMRDLGLTVYVDLGCWYGLLLRGVMDAAPWQRRPAAGSVGPGRSDADWALTRVIAVEAIPAICEFTSGLSRGVEFINAVIVPERMRGEAVAPSIHPWDTSRSGLFVEGGTRIEGVPARTAPEVLGALSPREIESAYLKIDLEGCDEEIVTDVLDAGLRPGAIHFEVLAQRYADRPILEQLRRAGYRTPAQHGLHSIYSLVCTKSRAAAVGFGPDSVYVD